MGRNVSLEMGELTDTAYYILLSLVDAKHGYLIMQTIEEMTEQRFSIGPASMYTTIKKLLAAELIQLFDDHDPKRKTYIATEKGIDLLKNEVKRRREMVSHAEEVFKKRGEQLI
ncbi:DNA-binding PadR family transcriptional regulator [Neobacillus niacini]|uniref:PadR family transcriptional regulator n=1 Tax=Neobacillus niacini TaxID=86668 RepID=UPI001053A400|nr:PadR family transcriptional regulator [Neobacillus niacini]MDR7080566.1 DNA-binding PadR family transcriptional regulator [Neobacillus niacini]